MSERFVEEYWEKGWTVVEGVFGETDVDDIVARATQLCFEDLERRERSTSSVDVDDEGRPVPRKLDFPFLLDPVFRHFAMTPDLRSLISQLIGVEPFLVVDQIFMKPPKFGSAKPYHQDNAYFRCHPDDEVVTAWIALDDVDESNGCLRYIDGSHRLPILEHHVVPGEAYNLEPALDQIDLSKESLAPVGKGGVVFHHVKTLHTSHRNTSERWRRAYATHWAGSGVTSEVETIDKAYYRTHRSLYNDFLVGSATE